MNQTFAGLIEIGAKRSQVPLEFKLKGVIRKLDTSIGLLRFVKDIKNIYPYQIYQCTYNSNNCVVEVDIDALRGCRLD